MPVKRVVVAEWGAARESRTRREKRPHWLSFFCVSVVNIDGNMWKKFSSLIWMFLGSFCL